ncbi:MAG: YrdB family protein [Gaiellaceae bacterium]
MVAGIRTANLVLRFALELAALVALAAWGFHTGDSWASDIALGIGAPLAAAGVWGAFVAPKARFVVPLGVRVVFELLVFGAAVLALWAADWFAAAFVLAAAVVVSELLLYGLGDPQQRRI